jgi:hypothetical protein
MIKVKDEPNLSRDKSGVIHNTANDEYREFIAKRNSKLELDQRLTHLETHCEDNRKMLETILSLLQDKK